MTSVDLVNYFLRRRSAEAPPLGTARLQRSLSEEQPEVGNPLECTRSGMRYGSIWVSYVIAGSGYGFHADRPVRPRRHRGW